MTETTTWLGRLLPVVLGAVTGTGVWMLFGVPEAPGRRACARSAAELDAKLDFLRSSLRGRHVLRAQGVAVLLGFGLGVAVKGGWPVLLCIPGLVLAPKAVLERRAARRVARVEEQIEGWLNAIANALKASPSLGEALASSISLVQAPLSEEVDVLVKEYELGTPLDRALDNFAERLGSETLSGTVLALKVARQSGGNLPEMLESAAAALRELARLEGVVRTKTAEGKAQAAVIAAIPAPMIGGLHWLDPRFFEPLASSFVGNLIVAGAVALWGLAILAARKILMVDI